MDKLPQIKATPKYGNEKLTFEGGYLDHSVLDFWRWSTSDILSNATRGKFAEFIVGTAIGIDIEKPRAEWDSYDLITDAGIKIEVKSASYIQCWEQCKYSTIQFSIKPARYWDVSNGTQGAVPKRHADIYVFCLLECKDQNTIDPLKMEQWKFFVLPTSTLDNYPRSQSSITLNSLEKLTRGVTYEHLKKEIEKLSAGRAVISA